MFWRRQRGVLPTALILILFVSMGYGIYLYNALQEKLHAVELKSNRFQSQHQSLSVQLQKVYEDRSKAQSSLMQEKEDHKRTKHEHDLKVEEHNRAIEKLQQEHNKSIQT